MNDDKKRALKFLKIAQGQLSASIEMLAEDRYCIDVSNQILATISLLKKSNEVMINQHLSNCVRESFLNHNEEEKIEELTKLIHKMIG